MPEKKFKLSRRTVVTAAVSAALIGVLTAAAVTAPKLMEYAFNADRYTYTETRDNGDVAYEMSSVVGGKTEEEKKTSEDDKKDESSTEQGKKKKKQEEQEDATPSPRDRNRRPDTDDKPTDKNKDNKLEDEKAKPDKTRQGTSEEGYTLVNTKASTDVAESRDDSVSEIGKGEKVEMSDEEASIESLGNQPQEQTMAPIKTLTPTSVPATKAPSVPVATRAPHGNTTSGSTGGSNNNGSTGGNNGGGHQTQPSKNPVQTIVPDAQIKTPEPATPTPPTTAPTAEPTPAPTTAPTKAPMPTAMPETSKAPSQIVTDIENQGGTVEISKGDIGITGNSGGGSSMGSSGATSIDFTKFTGDQSSVEYIHISSTIRKINFETAKLLFPNLKGFVVAENNKYYKSIDGVLYSKDGTILYACPAKVESISEYPEELEKIHDGAFIGSEIKELNLPNTVTTVGKNAFAEAAMGTVTFNSDKLTIGDTAFFNSKDDGLSIKTIIFNSKKPPEVDANTALKFKNPNTGLDTAGMKIVVPDSEDDSVLCDYIKAWGETIDGIYGSGMTDTLFSTEKGANKNYKFENNALYKKVEQPEGEETTEKYELLYVAPSTDGEFKPAEGTIKIADGAFDNCEKITAITLPSSVEELENGSLDGLKNLVSIMVSSQTPAKIGNVLFQALNPNEFKIYVYPDSRDDFLKEWGAIIDEIFGENTADKIINAAADEYKYIDGALYTVSADGKYTLIDAPHTNGDNFIVDANTVKINAGAFSDKYEYGYVFIPETVKEIDAEAFRNAKIEVLVLTSEEPAELAESFEAANIEKLYVPKASLEKYKELWGEHAKAIEAPSDNYVSDSKAIYGVSTTKTFTLYNVPKLFEGKFTMLENTKEIAAQAIKDCTGIEEISFSVVIDKVGEESLSGLTKVKHIDMSKLTLLTELPDKVFKGSSGVEKLDLPVLLKSLGDSAAEDMSSLESVNFSDLAALERIGNRAFFNNTSLTTVSLSANRKLTELGESAFENASSLQTVRMPLNVTKMSNRLFKNASSLNRVSMSSNMEEIGDEALYGTAITAFNITGLTNVTTIGEGALAECKNLTEIALPIGVTKVSARLAQNDTALTKVTLGKETEEIGEAAFKGAAALEEIELPETLKKIGKDSFAECVTLKKITLYAEVPPEAGENAFGENMDELKIYVPAKSYEDYLKAWDSILYNKAEQVIVKPEGGSEDTPSETTKPSESPKPSEEPETSESPQPSEEPESSESPQPSEEPESSESPKPSEEPQTSDKPQTSEEPQPSEEPQVSGAPEQSKEPLNTETLAPTSAPEPSEPANKDDSSTPEPQAVPMKEEEPSLAAPSEAEGESDGE